MKRLVLSKLNFFLFRPFEKRGGTLYSGGLVFFVFVTHAKSSNTELLQLFFERLLKFFINVFPVSRKSGLKFLVFAS